jgi:tetratricopeptide (TPR) repeat protein
VGEVLRDQGDLTAALTEYRAELDITQRLAEKDPGNAQWQQDLSVSHEKVGNVLLDQGDRAGALTEYRAELDITQRLAEKDPANAVWQRGLLVSYTKIGLAADQRNDFPAALDAFEKAEKIALHLKEINATAATSAQNLSWVRAKLEETRRKIAGSAVARGRKK